MEGFTDIFVTGKGFASNIADKAKCRFGVVQIIRTVEWNEALTTFSPILQ